ncbi:endothelin-converting enzyme 1-like [Mya arenaria]|uniref:endothelin-converting enzyme 1-like n=1 Tax=Mya arenaria TaxID=6604 RepID=UPI0022E735B6|nr:endothelin-converting enzyme 1-like [Mya arenaria]XP_052759923.1 endothelin-converting enzyme 1-like [Mya arenaria]
MTEMRGDKSTHMANGTGFVSSTHRRTCMEKVLALVLATFAIAVIVLAALLVQSYSSTQKDICLTKECTDVAARVINAIDYSVNPCDNFYDFACGTWMKKHVVPEDRSNLYTYGVVRENVKITLKYLLEGDKEAHVEAVKKARDYYQACMNETHIELMNASELADILTNELGGWPTLGSNAGGNWNESLFNFEDDLIRLRTLGGSPIIKIYVGTDEKDSGKKILMVQEPYLNLGSRDYFFKDEHEDVRQAFMTYMTNMAVHFGADEKTAREDSLEVFALDSDLANITLSKEESRKRDDRYNKMTIAELERQFPTLDVFDWSRLIQRLVQTATDNITITEEEHIVMETPKYYKEVFKILKKHRNRTIKNYIMWSYVSRLVSRLPKRFLDESQTLRKVQYGNEMKQSRWKQCSQSTMYDFGMAVGRLFVLETFDVEAKHMALEMISDIREAFNERLDELDWMDPETKKVAIEKAKHIKEMIGFPDFILNDTALNKYYEEVTVDDKHYFTNTVEIMKVVAMKSLKSLRSPNEKDPKGWDIPPAVVNAFYSPLSNVITFPAGMLQPPYYSKYQPRSMNYGSIGWLIGHEITHAFDDAGRMYDKDGNLQNWWKPEAIMRFNNKTSCIVDQYNSYVAPHANMNLNGEYTKGENIADNGGLQQSWKAYRTWKGRSKVNEQGLPGLDYSHEQLFFINFAQGWCGVTTAKRERDQILTDSHSPGRFRIIGSLQNSKEFSEVFNCPRGSYMNPEKKCHVW